jgi:hypothetical protein
MTSEEALSTCSGVAALHKSEVRVGLLFAVRTSTFRKYVNLIQWPVGEFSVALSCNWQDLGLL